MRITGSKSVSDTRTPEMPRIENLSKACPDGVQALKGVSLEIPSPHGSLPGARSSTF